MSIQFYPNGIGGTAPGDSLDLARPLQTSGNVWYVSSLIGTDAASPAGQNREKPLATIAQAVTNAADDDIVVFLAGHAQTLTATQVIAKRITFVGEGTVAGKPAASFTSNFTSAVMLSATAADVEFRNLYFPNSLQLTAFAKVDISAADVLVKGCYFDCGDKDSFGVSLTGAANRPRFANCTFISTATLLTAQPIGAIVANGAVTTTGFYINDTVISAGTVGFSRPSAIDLSAASSIGRIKIENLDLLLGADVNLGAGIVTGRVNIQLATGGSRVNWS